VHLLLADRVAPARSLSATLVSVVLHVGLIAVVVATGQRVVDTVRDLIEQSVQYLYPAPKEVGLDRLGLQREAIGSIARTQGPGNPQAVTGADRTGMKAMLSREGIEYAPIPLQGDSPHRPRVSTGARRPKGRGRCSVSFRDRFHWARRSIDRARDVDNA